MVGCGSELRISIKMMSWSGGMVHLLRMAILTSTMVSVGECGQVWAVVVVVGWRQL